MCGMLNSKDAKTQIIYETQNVCAVIKFGKRSRHVPIDFLVVPKKHYTNLQSPGAETVCNEMVSLIQHLAGQDGEYQIRCNNGTTAGQTLFHLHWHVSSKQSIWPSLQNHLGSRSLDFPFCK